eukprot:COSAG02_NODE_2942_length_7692_cov_3.853154_12_plen_131_part_00
MAVGNSIAAFWKSAVGTKTGPCTAADDTLTLTLPADHQVQTISLQESLESGQHVAGYTLEVQYQAALQGVPEWKAVSSRETIGRMFLHDIGAVISDSATIAAVRVRCTHLVAASAANVTISAMTRQPTDL